MTKSIITTKAFDISIFEIDQEKGMVNLTKIADYFGKRVSDWRQKGSTKKFLRAFFFKNPEPQNLVVVNGGDYGNGTWASRKLALKFAEWISVDFEIYANEVIDTLFRTGKVELQPQQPLSLTEVLEQSQAWIMTLAQENTTLKLQVNESKEVIVTQTDKINELAPKARFIDETFVNTNSLSTMNMFAKEIKIGIVKLYQLLRDNHIMFYALNQYNKFSNNVHAKYINNGCFEIKQTYSERLNQCFDKIFVTPKGKLLCYKLVRESEELKNSVIDGNTSIVKVNYYGKH